MKQRKKIMIEIDCYRNVGGDKLCGDCAFEERESFSVKCALPKNGVSDIAVLKTGIFKVYRCKKCLKEFE